MSEGDGAAGEQDFFRGSHEESKLFSVLPVLMGGEGGWVKQKKPENDTHVFLFFFIEP